MAYFHCCCCTEGQDHLPLDPRGHLFLRGNQKRNVAGMKHRGMATFDLRPITHSLLPQSFPNAPHPQVSGTRTLDGYRGDATFNFYSDPWLSHPYQVRGALCICSHMPWREKAVEDSQGDHLGSKYIYPCPAEKFCPTFSYRSGSISLAMTPLLASQCLGMRYPKCPSNIVLYNSVGPLLLSPGKRATVRTRTSGTGAQNPLVSHWK